jgi:hypothetical protein
MFGMLVEESLLKPCTVQCKTRDMTYSQVLSFTESINEKRGAA